jgi:hypothetical protein
MAHIRIAWATSAAICPRGDRKSQKTAKNFLFANDIPRQGDCKAGPVVTLLLL